MDSLTHIYILEQLKDVVGKPTKLHLFGTILPDASLTLNSEVVGRMHDSKTYRSFVPSNNSEKQLNVGALIHTLADVPAHGSQKEIIDVKATGKLPKSSPYFLAKANQIADLLQKTYKLEKGDAIVWGHNILEFVGSYLLVKKYPELMNSLNNALKSDLNVVAKYMAKVGNTDVNSTKVALNKSKKLLKKLKYGSVKEVSETCAIVGAALKKVMITSHSVNLIKKILDMGLLNDYQEFLDDVIKKVRAELVN